MYIVLTMIKHSIVRMNLDYNRWKVYAILPSYIFFIVQLDRGNKKGQKRLKKRKIHSKPLHNKKSWGKNEFNAITHFVRGIMILRLIKIKLGIFLPIYSRGRRGKEKGLMPKLKLLIDKQNVLFLRVVFFIFNFHRV